MCVCVCVPVCVCVCVCVCGLTPEWQILSTQVPKPEFESAVQRSAEKHQFPRTWWPWNPWKDSTHWLINWTLIHRKKNTKRKEKEKAIKEGEEMRERRKKGGREKGKLCQTIYPSQGKSDRPEVKFNLKFWNKTQEEIISSWVRNLSLKYCTKSTNTNKFNKLYLKA